MPVTLAAPAVAASPPPWSTSAAAQPLAPADERAQIIAGLLDEPARISPKYFYDERGSQLFEAITRLPEYYPTRTEQAVLRRHARAIAQAVGRGGVVIEPGAGSCDKARVLCRLLGATHFVGVDISADYLEGAVARLRAALPGLDARAVGGDITAAIELPGDVPQDRRLVFYPGSSIGNFDPPAALALLRQMHALVQGEGGGLLIGIDLPKDLAVLQAAYDDVAGVTAQFNRNILAHVNRLIGSDFEPGQWRHEAFFNTAASRIEMHLAACGPQQVRWPGGGRSFAAHERIHTENSYKYPLPAFLDLLARAGFRQPQAWTDERGWYALVHART
ncbi:L-histidine N(alpha)-methyltransferase [Pulveribacter sp.]|uniref:L-histidine N(alpha)-methyltransferase n=1 Tax=Pulveribacter sp. TaxID=2678893 RepID=UPI0028AE04E4|nr:L-histidine N(alpha)-methyltransferase [Pulveribacter sp.]